MTEVVTKAKDMTIIVPDTKESSALLSDQLKAQLDGLKPVHDFYEHLVNGWHQRILLAEETMQALGNQSESQQTLFLELRNAAKGELEKYLPVYKEIQTLEEEIKTRVREFEVMKLKKSIPQSSNDHHAVIDFKEVRNLVLQADALIEMRKEEQ